MKNKKILIFLLLIIGIGIIGFTGAYFINNMQLENEFNTSEYGATFNEIFESPNDWEPGDVTEKIVYATNNGDADIAVRISYQELWESADGTELANTQDGKSIAVVNLVHTNDWVKIGNYYYYKYRLKKNDRTSDFMKSVTFNDEVDFSVNCEFLNTYYAGNCSYTTGDYYGATYTLNITIETILFDNYKDIWGSNIDLLDNKPLTGVEKLVQKSNPSSVTNYNDGVKQEMYVFNHQATVQTGALTDYRYIGNIPNNYAYFNCTDDSDTSTCEVWRIMGIFNVDDGNGYYEQRIKLVRGTDFAETKLWNTVRNNNWPDSSLNAYLNGTYYDSLSSTAQGMIDDARYYLGGSKVQNLDAEEMYKWERGTKVYTGHATYWDGKIAVMYPSDQYLTYSKGIDSVCYNDPSSCQEFDYNSETGQYDIPRENPGHPTTSWIFNSNVLEGSSATILNLFISPGYQYDRRIYAVHSYGVLGVQYTDTYGGGVRPVVYLNSDVMIDSGTGQENDPYVLSY